MTSSTPPWERDAREVLLDAIHDSQTRPATRDFELSQLWGSIAGQPELEEVFLKETGPERVVANFRLSGDAVEDHSVDAELFTKLIKGISEATVDTAEDEAEQAKAQAKLGHPVNLSSYARPLQLTAIRQGSVRFSLEAQQRPDTNDDGIPGFSPEDLDDRALRQVLAVLFSDGNDTLLSTLPQKARQKLEPAADALAHKGLAVEVSVHQRHQDTWRREVDKIDATNLLNTLREPHEVPSTTNGVYQYDGHKDSEQKLYLIVNGQSTGFNADPHLIARVRQLEPPTADRHLWLSCTVEILETSAHGKKTKKTRTLISAEPVPRPQSDAADEPKLF